MRRPLRWPGPGRSPLNLTLAGMPEMELFPSATTRELALRELSGQSRLPRSMMLAVAATVAVMILVSITARWLLFDLLPLPPGVAVPLFALTLAVTLLVAVRTLHQRIFRRGIRRKLLEVGVPVCMRCGYALHGLAEDAARCPECGTALDDRARELISAASPDRSPPEPGGR